ncbi:MAG: Gmad2 immunoglobulin-like domain-containing protein [Candidatus Pacebacteria bacterium]|nr:Gmad2 immunoglobulin-like domain-containing protein [Candidatus Paceibacterota bacterium]
MNNKKNLYVIIGFVVIVGALGFIFSPREKALAPAPNTTPKVTYNNASDDLITVALPYPGGKVLQNFSVMGQARGSWFFEASFPVEVFDKDGKTIATGIAQAQKEWMTTEFVPFRADIKISKIYTGPATLVLKKDNPSGLSEKDASISFPVIVQY